LVAAREAVSVEDLPEELGGARRRTADLYAEFASLAEGLEAFERYYVARVLAEENGELRSAARRLGLSLAELEKRLEQGL
jgi:transcriptional regulator with PAS, ATPase and Fis domain